MKKQDSFKGIVAEFSGRCPDSYKRFVETLELLRQDLLEVLADTEDFLQAKHIQGQVYMLKRLLGVLKDGR